VLSGRHMLGPGIIKDWTKASRDGTKVLRKDHTKTSGEDQTKMRSGHKLRVM
jgi:hypothetical protein